MGAVWGWGAYYVLMDFPRPLLFEIEPEADRATCHTGRALTDDIRWRSLNRAPSLSEPAFYAIAQSNSNAMAFYSLKIMRSSSRRGRE